jgi:Ca2+-transporting ATPase
MEMSPPPAETTPSANNFGIKGLTAEQVLKAREQYGSNNLIYRKENALWKAVKELVSEPMVLLLLIAAVIYFANGATGDAIFMIASIILISAISLYQYKKSRNALKKLEEFNQPLCKVIRDGVTSLLNIEHLVIGDCFVAEEGIMIPADAEIIRSNDFFVNESALTGESLPVYKGQDSMGNNIYRGTVVVSGLAIAKVIAIGNNTRWGQIGKSLEKVNDEKTPLELQIGYFVRLMVIAGTLVFVAVWVLNFLRSHQFADSLLKSLTLAMSILPEEIPVAFTTFMALGTFRLMKIGVIVKQMKTVESLGSATVICVDKTGTITENAMSIASLWAWPTGRIAALSNDLVPKQK